MANYAKTNIGNEGRVELHYTLSLTGAEISEYSRAVTPQIRQAGNRLSGLAETAYASLLA